MARYIDADASMKNFAEYSDDPKLIAMFNGFIKRQPTIFDMDKVIDELEKRTIENTRCALLEGNSIQKKISLICRADEGKVAIEIVKRGVNHD